MLPDEEDGEEESLAQTGRGHLGAVAHYTTPGKCVCVCVLHKSLSVLTVLLAIPNLFMLQLQLALTRIDRSRLHVFCFSISALALHNNFLASAFYQYLLPTICIFIGNTHRTPHTHRHRHKEVWLLLFCGALLVSALVLYYYSSWFFRFLRFLHFYYTILYV